jgi:hypothetical protein
MSRCVVEIMYLEKPKYLNLERREYIYIRDEDTDVMNQRNYRKEIFQPKPLTRMASHYQIGTNCNGLSLSLIFYRNFTIPLINHVS